MIATPYLFGTKKAFSKALKTLFLSLFLCLSMNLSAQPGGFEDDVDDETEPVAAIDASLQWALLGALALGGYFLIIRSKNSLKHN